MGREGKRGDFFKQLLEGTAYNFQDSGVSHSGGAGWLSGPPNHAKL